MGDIGVHPALVLAERAVDLDVAVDRGLTLEPQRRVGGAAAHLAGEGEGAGLGADHVEPGGLRDQAGVEAVVALECREGAEAAVLLRGHRLEHDLAGGPPAHGGEGVERGHHRALHVHRAAAVEEAVLDRARPRAEAPLVGAGRHHVHVAVHAQARRALEAGQRDGQAEQLLARRLLARMRRVRAQGGEVVLVELRLEPQRPRQLGQPL